MTLHLGLLRISLQHRYFVQTSFPSFFPSFLLLFYVFSKWKIYFFILVFSDPTLFCLLLFLSSTFPHLSFSFCLFLSLSPASFLDVLSLFILYFLFLVLSLSLFVFYFPSSTFSLSSVISPLLFSLSFCVFYYYCYPPVLIFCICYLSVCCLPFLFIFLYFFSLFSYFFLFSTLFNYLFLMIGFNYCNFPLLFL